MTVRSPLRALGGVGLLASILATVGASVGCGKMCTADFVFSGVHLTLHLPPEKDVVRPETVRVCQQPKCRAAFVPPLAIDSASIGFAFPQSHATGMVNAAAGGVRVLSISWPLEMDDAFNPKDPRNQYDVDVLDANAAQTGKLSASVTYAHILDEDCGVDAWQASASD
jgi:hypothetical protein